MKSVILVLVSIISCVDLAESFVYEDCSGGKGVMDIYHFDVSPDPISFSENITVSMAQYMLQDIPMDALVTTEFYKITTMLGSSVPLRAPCIWGMGSCTMKYCDFLNIYKDYYCPFFPADVECECPFKKGLYQGNVSLAGPNFHPVLQYILSGRYEIVLKVYVEEESEENILSCLILSGKAEYGTCKSP